MGPSTAIFTIGHSNHALTRFLDLLEAHRIDLVVDVRSHPWSRYATHFNREQLPGALARERRFYEFLGAELGGRPESEGLYDEEGHVLYNRVAETESFAAGLSRLEEEATTRRIALMCSEENPSTCHRRLLVARVLVDRGVEVIHIRGNGSLEREDNLRAAEQARKAQTSLFEDSLEAEPWRSTQSVLRRRPLKSSSSS